MRLGELDSKTNLCDNNRNLCSEPQDYEIETIMHHPSYDMPKYANDVALIRLRQTTNSSMFSTMINKKIFHNETNRFCGRSNRL